MALRVQQLPELPGSRLTDPRVWVATLGIAAIGLGGLIVRDLYFPPVASLGAVRTVTVATGTVRNVVSGTGNLVPATQQYVAFKIAGQLTEVDVKVGDKVTQGEVLAKIDTSSLQSAVDTANGNLATAQANLNSVSTPLTSDQYAQLQHNLANAQQNLADTTTTVNLTNQQDGANVASDQQTLAADQAAYAADQAALNNSIVYTNDKAKLATDQQKLATDQGKYNSDGCLTGTTYQPTSLPCFTDQQNLVTDQQNVTADQLKVNQDPAIFAPSYNSDQAKVNADSAKLSADQARQQSDAAAGSQRIDSAQGAITSAQDAINVQSTVKPSALAQAQAGVANAQIALDTAITNLGYATLTAPAAGVIQNINGQPGETVSAATGVTAQSPGSVAPLTSNTTGSAFMVLSSAGGFQAQAPFAETDASKIAANQPAAVTFDAVSGLTLLAHVLAVAPSSTTTSNVVNYLVTFTLDKTDPRIKSGMTANITVIVNQVANVLNVTNSAIRRSGRTTYVTVLKNGREENVNVTLGLVGDTTTQIVAGLSAGDKVVLPTISVGNGTTRGAGGGVLGPGGGGFGGGRGLGG